MRLYFSRSPKRAEAPSSKCCVTKTLARIDYYDGRDATEVMHGFHSAKGGVRRDLTRAVRQLGCDKMMRMQRSVQEIACFNLQSSPARVH